MNEQVANVTRKVARSSIFNEDGTLADLQWPTDYLIIALIGIDENFTKGVLFIW